MKGSIILIIPFVVATAHACPVNQAGAQNTRINSLLDYIATAPASESTTVAECAAKVYRSVNIYAAAKDNPKRAENLMQEVGNAQLTASRAMRASGDTPAAERFEQQEIILRTQILDEIGSFDETLRASYRILRVRQLSYLTQALERANSGKKLHETLMKMDADIFQGQVTATWLKSVMSCPSWNIVSAGGISDSRLLKDACHSECSSAVRIAVRAVTTWKITRPSDWANNSELRDLYTRLSRTSNKCPE